MKRLLSALLLSGFVVTTQPIVAQNSCCQAWTSCMGSGYEYGMNPPVNFADTCSCTWVGHIDYLYWKPYEDCIEWTTKARTEGPSPAKISGDNKFINYDWDSGFRIGLGYAFPCDKWTLSIDWSHYRTDAKKAFTASRVVEGQIGFIETFFPPFIDTTSASVSTFILGPSNYVGKWRLQYNQVDLKLSRRYFAGPCLMLNPFVGVSVLTLKQDMNACIDIELTQSASPPFPGGTERIVGRYKCEFKGVGIIAGLDSNWELCSGLGIYGEWNIGAYYGTFDTSNQTVDTVKVDVDTFTEGFSSKKSFEALRVTNHLGIGLAWMSTFNCDRNMFTFRAGWEHNSYFSQNMFPILSIEDREFVTAVRYPKADLYLYGFRFSFGIGF